MSTVYARELTQLVDQIHAFRRRDLSLGELQSALWEASGVVASHEERVLREALRHAEAQLEAIQFTVEEADVFAEALKVADAVEARLRAAMPPP
ncbi:MAG: hypothetical protein HYS27_14155 [Deltaproteobacteria bacterium]|nr:hypothetical protein [Deltaproteobacteria bacterium]